MTLFITLMCLDCPAMDYIYSILSAMCTLLSFAAFLLLLYTRPGWPTYCLAAGGFCLLSSHAGIMAMQLAASAQGLPLSSIYVFIVEAQMWIVAGGVLTIAIGLYALIKRLTADKPV